MLSRIKKRAGLYGVAAIILAMILGVLCYNIELNPAEFRPLTSGLLKTFASYEELRNFFVANSKILEPPYYNPWGPFVWGSSEGARAHSVNEPGLELEHSTTNIQVSGVDEADIVKTDGEYIYILSGNKFLIVKANPLGEAEIQSQITLNNTNLAGIFISSNKLAILGCKYAGSQWSYFRYYYGSEKTFVNIYDISNKTNPEFLANFTISGSYLNSRMIGDYVYFVATQPVYIIYDTVVLPKIYSSSGFKEINPSEIHYYNASDDSYAFTTFVALNMQNATEEPTHITLMLGGASNMYVSLNNIYVTFPKSDEETTIYRIRIQNRTITPEAKGDVPGRELNQFSMDEYNNHFRIATTTRLNGTTQNNLYVLNMNLSITGRLENIAVNETIDSARFIENRCYLSTSIVRRDPFFVIDVENATEPKILGYLKIPGFTRYLHPYDENHIIGIGSDGNNVKISMFDVSNVSAPQEMGNYTVQGDWSETTVLSDHKAFLFDKSRDLLAIPVHFYYYRYNYWGWQGLYVFNITLSDGLVLRGNVTHLAEGAYHWDWNNWIKRALYIESVLYTLSDKKLKLNSLEDLTEIKEISFP